MKIAEIKELSTEELAERLASAKAAINVLEINHSISPLDNPAQIKQNRRTIARMSSELRSRELNK
ncbi:MAG: 50S ribosomal protein L29 [Bacteroidales bacterium]|nr:50S ribosomal protein L29 [Bacteroidales bacterium]